MKKLIKTLITIAVIAIIGVLVFLLLSSKGNLKYTLNDDGSSYSVGIDCNGFDTWSKDKNVTIPSTHNNKPVTTIDSSGFRWSNTVVSVTIPESVTTIGKGAFADCPSLISISVPDSLVEVEGEFLVTDIDGKMVEYVDTFYNSPNLKFNQYDNALYLGNENNPYVLLVKAKDKKITSCDIHSSTKVIAPGAFMDCTMLKKIFIPSDVRSIGSGAFERCKSLTEVTGGAGLIKIGSVAFAECSSLHSMLLVWNNADGSEPKLTCIETGAFRECTKLKNFVIPSTVIRIGAQAFMDCDSLKSIVIPKSVQTMGNGVFDNHDMTIYCEAESKPSGWDDGWYFMGNVKWGYTVSN